MKVPNPKLRSEVDAVFKHHIYCTDPEYFESHYKGLIDDITLLVQRHIKNTVRNPGDVHDSL